MLWWWYVPSMGCSSTLTNVWWMVTDAQKSAMTTSTHTS
jgi:hypothetical protein